MNSTDTLRILLVDDHEVVRLGLATLLDDVPGAALVGEAGTGAEALLACQQLEPDVVILDIRLPDQSGVEVCRQIVTRWPDIKVIILTSYVSDDLVMATIAAGAAGFVRKQVGNESLLQAIEAVRRGQSLLDPHTTQQVMQRMRRQEAQLQASTFQGLSRREMEVLLLVSQGKSNREIAGELSLSEKTVRNHLTRLFEKLGLNNRIELATYAVRHHLATVLAGDG